MNENKQGKRSRGKWIIVLAVVLVLAAGLTGVALYVGADWYGRSSDDRACTVEIAMGSSTQQIAQALEEAGVVESSLFFRVYSRMKGYDGQYQYGHYTVAANAPYEEVCQLLMTHGAKAQTVTVTIPEGTGINDYVKDVNGEDVTVPGIATLLEQAGVCTKDDFFAALDAVPTDSALLASVNAQTYYVLEGYLFPETYEFYAYDSAECARLAVERMLKETENRITDEMVARAEEMGYSIHDILTMASIIQMESGQNGGEMANVAAVFYNRLASNSFSTLGSSPTCYYGRSFADDDGRYDTYHIPGLPPGPLCSPGIAAINAALYPTENSPYYYFVTDSQGKFYFHKTAAEQQNTITALQQDGNWIYEYFD